MAAPEAAGEKNWDMERASDTFHPPTRVVATPDPILTQSEPRPPNPTQDYRHRRKVPMLYELRKLQHHRLVK